MPRRSRSRSPGRERRRDGERHRDRGGDRDRDRERGHRRRRSRSPAGQRRRSRSPRRRSRSPHGRRRSRSRDRTDSSGRSSHQQQQYLERPQIDESQFEGKTAEEIEMMKLMGFGGFDSTKGKKVQGNDSNHAANVQTKRKYRQYMNRRGGFNRPLDFIA